MFPVKSSTLDFQRHIRQNANKRNCQELVRTQRTVAFTNEKQI